VKVPVRTMSQYKDATEIAGFGTELILYKRADLTSDAWWFRARIEGRRGYIRRSTKEQDLTLAIAAAKKSFYLKFFVSVFLVLILVNCSPSEVSSEKSALTKPNAKAPIAIGQLEPHRKSKHVDYSKKHTFTYEKGKFFVDGMNSYRRQYLKFYGRYNERYEGNSTFQSAMSYIWIPRDGYGRTKYPCLPMIYTPDYTMSVKFVETAGPEFASASDFENHMYRKSMFWCTDKVKRLVHEDVIRGERRGNAITYFFETLMPRFLENDSWLGLPYNIAEPGEDFIPEQQAIEALLYTYIYFSDWYGTSDELDEKFVSYFRKYERTRHKHIKSDRNKRFITKCPIDIWQARSSGPRHSGDAFLACKQEFWTMLYAMMAVRFQDNDILNEALFFYKHNAKYTFEEGATIEVTRGYKGPGYAIMAAEFFDQGAWVIEAFTDAEVYTIEGGGKYNNTVGKMIDGSIDAFANPSKYYKYAKQYNIGNRPHTEPDLPTIPHNNYRTVGAFLDGSKSGKWNKYLNNVGDRGYTIRLAIDPLFMSRAYNFTPSYRTD